MARGIKKFHIESLAQPGRANNYLKCDGDLVLFDDRNDENRAAAWRTIARQYPVTKISIWKGHGTKMQDGTRIQCVDKERLDPIPDVVRVIGMPGPKEKRGRDGLPALDLI